MSGALEALRLRRLVWSNQAKEAAHHVAHLRVAHSKGGVELHHFL